MDLFISSQLHKIISYESNTTTAYSTPLNSPGLKRLLKRSKKSELETVDYFGDIDNYKNNISNEYVWLGGTPTIHDYDHFPQNKQLYLKSNNYNNVGRSPSNGIYHTMNNNRNIEDNLLNDYNTWTNFSKTPIKNNIDNGSFKKLKKENRIKPIDIDATIQRLLDAGYAAKRTKNVRLKNFWNYST